jgi:hypothetical protein
VIIFEYLKKRYFANDIIGEREVPMGWQAEDEPDPGEVPDPEHRLAGFGKGGEWDTSVPSPELAAVLAEVAGPEWRCPEATDDQLDGILGRIAALEAWAAAARLGVVREKIRRDDTPHSGRPRHGDLPDVWSETVNREVSLALGLSVPAAARMTFLAWDAGARLPGLVDLLTAGALSYVAVRLISEAWLLLSDEDVAKAEKLLLLRLADGTARTVGQIANLAARIAAQVDPGLAERQRKAAQKHRARVELFRESAGTAALCGRDLPPDETLAANANVSARAAKYKESGAFADGRMDQYRATAYCYLLNGVPAWERIASGRLIGEDTPGTRDQTSPADNGEGPDGEGPDSEGPASDNPGDGPGRGPGGVPPTAGAPASTDGVSDGDRGDDDGDHADGDHGDRVHGDGGHGDRVDGDRVDGDCGNGDRVDGDVGHGDCGNGDNVHGSGGGLGGGLNALDFPFRWPPPGPPGYQPRLTDLVLPLATLCRNADLPGESHGFGVLDPALCRELAGIAIRSPHTTVCVTVTDSQGIAIGHGCVGERERDRAPTGRRTTPVSAQPPPLAALPGRINLTVTAARLTALLNAQSATPRPLAAPGWAITPDPAARQHPRGRPRRSGDPDWCRAWTLRVPSGLAFTVRLEPVPTHDCDHRFESGGYQPSGVLRHLVQIRDRSCTFPTCNRHARDADFEHGVPYAKGGKTDACNGSARSRSCHRVKQSVGWKVTQPRPGWHSWTTPSGRTYTQTPYRYPV